MALYSKTLLNSYGRCQQSHCAITAATTALWLTCTLVATIPLEGVPLVAPGQSITYLVGLPVFGAGILAALSRRRLRRLASVHVPAIAVTVWAGLTYMWSIDRESTATRFISYCQLLGMFWLILEFARTARQVEALVVSYIVGCAIAVSGIYYNLSLGQTIAHTTRVSLSGTDPNDIAVHLVISLVFAWKLARQATSRHRRLLLSAYICLASVAIALSGSRGGVLCAVAVLLGIACLRSRLRPASILVFLLLLGLVGYAVLSIVPSDTLQRFSTLDTELRTGDWAKRKLVWQAGWEVADKSPIIGVGAGTFSYAIPPIMGFARVAHNTYLSVLVEQGLVGLTLLIAMVWVAGKQLKNLVVHDRRIWILALVVWSVGIFALTWEYRKGTWFLLAVTTAAGSATARQNSGQSAMRE